MKNHYVRGEFSASGLLFFDFLAKDETSKELLIQAIHQAGKAMNADSETFYALDEEATFDEADPLGCNMLIETFDFDIWSAVIKENDGFNITVIQKKVSTGFYGNTGGNGVWIASVQDDLLWLEPLQAVNKLLMPGI